jgi:hypothetical protein
MVYLRKYDRKLLLIFFALLKLNTHQIIYYYYKSQVAVFIIKYNISNFIFLVNYKVLYYLQ